MLLRGSCQCGKVRFRVQSDTPYPFMFCYCSICRKTTGALTSNVMGQRATLVVHGEKHLRCRTCEVLDAYSLERSWREK